MNNIQKAFKTKAQMGMRACMADGGQLSNPDPSKGPISTVNPAHALDQFKYAIGMGGPSGVDMQVARAMGENPQPVAAVTDPAYQSKMESQGLRFANGGGLVKGPGTGTSDSVPAMYSNGEYVLPKDTVDAVGVEKLDAIKDATHTPVHKGLHAGKPHMADGGFLDGVRQRISGLISPSAPLSTAGAAGTTPPIAEPVPPAAAAPAPAAAPVQQPGISRSPGMYESSAARDSAAFKAANPAPAEAAGDVASTGLRAGAGKALSVLGRVAGGVGGAVGAVQDARDINVHGLNADNGTGLAGNALLAAGSVAAAPLAVTAGTGALVGNYLGNAINRASPRLSEALTHPVDAASRWFNGGDAMRPEQGAGHVGGDTYTPGRSLDSYKDGTSPAAPAVPQSDSDAAFNKTLADRGAGSVSMSTDAQGVRTLGNGVKNPYDRGISSGSNSQPALQAINDRAGRDAAEADLQHKYAADAATAQAAQRAGAGHGADTSQIDAQISQALAAGRPAHARELVQARTAMMNNANTNAMTARGQDVTADDNRRTTDVSLRGHVMAQQTAFALRQMEQGNKNREFAQKQQENNTADRASSQKALNDQLGTMFTTKDDKGNVVPDNARVASASQKIQDEIGARIKDARAVPQSDPNHARAQQLADTLESRGHAALAPDDMREMLSQAAVRDRVLATKSMLPGGSAPNDSRLNGYGLKSRSSNLVGSDTLSLDNGTKVRANDLRYTEPANAVLPDFGHVPTDQFNAGLRRKAQ